MTLTFTAVPLKLRRKRLLGVRASFEGGEVGAVRAVCWIQGLCCEPLLSPLPLQRFSRGDGQQRSIRKALVLDFLRFTPTGWFASARPCWKLRVCRLSLVGHAVDTLAAVRTVRGIIATARSCGH